MAVGRGKWEEEEECLMESRLFWRRRAGGEPTRLPEYGRLLLLYSLALPAGRRNIGAIARGDMEEEEYGRRAAQGLCYGDNIVYIRVAYNACLYMMGRGRRRLTYRYILRYGESMILGSVPGLLLEEGGGGEGRRRNMERRRALA